MWAGIAILTVAAPVESVYMTEFVLVSGKYRSYLQFIDAFFSTSKTLVKQ